MVHKDTLLLNLVETLTRFGSKLDRKTLTLLSRLDYDDLFKLLSIKNLKYLTEITTSEEFIIPDLPEISREDLWKKYLIKTRQRDLFNKFVLKDCPETIRAIVKSFDTNVPLLGSEIIQKFDGKENMRACSFSYSQICNVVSRHTKTTPRAKWILDKEKKNYFFITTPNGALKIVSIWQRNDTPKDDKWNGWFWHDTTPLERGRLHLRLI